jgi:hypothetical protein
VVVREAVMDNGLPSSLILRRVVVAGILMPCL